MHNITFGSILGEDCDALTPHHFAQLIPVAQCALDYVLFQANATGSLLVRPLHQDSAMRPAPRMILVYAAAILLTSKSGADRFRRLVCRLLSQEKGMQRLQLACMDIPALTSATQQLHDRITGYVIEAHSILQQAHQGQSGGLSILLPRSIQARACVCWCILHLPWPALVCF